MAKSPLNDFISKVKQDGLARNNRFLVCITPKQPYQLDPTGSWLQDVLLLCDQVQLPGTNFNTSDMRTYGETRKAPYERLYEDINMSFYVDTSMTVKYFFDNWMTYIQNPGTRNFNYYDDYTSDITIEVQDLKNQTRYAVQLREAFPKSIGAVQLDQSNKDIMKISVNFAYKYYVIGDPIYIPNSDHATGGFASINFSGDSISRYQPIFNQTPSAVRTQTDPLNSFINRLKNFAIGAVGSKIVTKLPGILRR